MAATSTLLSNQSFSRTLPWPTNPPDHYDEAFKKRAREVQSLVENHHAAITGLIGQLVATGYVSGCTLCLPGESLYVAGCGTVDFEQCMQAALDTSLQESDIGNPTAHTLAVSYHSDGLKTGFLFCTLSEKMPAEPAVYLARSTVLLLEKEIELVKSRQRLNYYATFLQKKTREMSEKSQFSSNMLSIATHDLSSPLNAVNGYLDLLSEQLARPSSPEKVSEYYEHITAGIQDIFELLKQLQNISQVQSGQFKLQMAVFDANWFVQDITDFLRPVVEKKGKNIQVICANEPVHTRVDLAMIRRILTNIIMNAVKYTGDDGRIIVRVIKKTTQLRIAVSDNGIGIPPDKQAYIFEPFIRLKSHLSESDNTSRGLGLFISSYLSKAMDGKVLVESEEGKGSTFTVELPIASM